MLYYICLLKENLSLKEMEWLIPRKSLFFFSRDITSNSYLSVIESTIDQFPFHLEVLNILIILSFMLLFPKHMSELGHPIQSDWDDSFSVRICKMKILIKSHIAVY